MELAWAGLYLHLSLPETAVATPVGTSSAADDPLLDGRVCPIQPHGSVCLAPEHWDTGLWQPRSSLSHEAVPAVHVVVTQLTPSCVLCAS